MSKDVQIGSGLGSIGILVLPTTTRLYVVVQLLSQIAVSSEELGQMFAGGNSLWDVPTSMLKPQYLQTCQQVRFPASRFPASRFVAGENLHRFHSVRVVRLSICALESIYKVVIVLFPCP
jgi:hypothetical protein